MTAYEQGYYHFLKCAGLSDDIQNMRRANRGEETDLQMGVNTGLLGLGAAAAPSYTDRLLGLEQVSSGPELPMGERLKQFYTGARLPSAAKEDYVSLLAGPDGYTPAQANEAQDLMDSFLEGSTGSRTKNVLRQAASDFPTYARRHPFLLGLGALGATGLANSAHGVGKGIYERHLGGAEQGVTPGDVALAAGGIGALGLGAAGLYEANQRGMLPRINIEMPGQQKQAGLGQRVQDAWNTKKLEKEIQELWLSHDADFLNPMVDTDAQVEAIRAMRQRADGANMDRVVAIGTSGVGALGLAGAGINEARHQYNDANRPWHEMRFR